INGMIKYKLADENIPIGIIAMELNFSSQPQFCRYCKKNLGYTTGEWRKQLRNKNKDMKEPEHKAN
ncbi:helix-turn-helix domain-containing protein, partial [Bacteroides fragilis]